MQQNKPPDPPRRFPLAAKPDPIGYGFGPFLVDPVRRLVWQDRRVVALTGRTFELLIILLRHRDRIIDKNTLLAAIWGDITVQENNLVRHVSTLRRALGQRPEQHDYIVTVSGRGYRFVGHVQELSELPSNLPLSTTPPAESAERLGLESGADDLAVTEASPATAVVMAEPTAHSGRPRFGIVLGASATVLAIAAAVWLSWPMLGSEPSRMLRQFTYDAGLQVDPAWAPDGRRIVYASNREGGSSLWIQSITDPTPIRLTVSSGADTQPDWSPDGRSIVFRSERDGGGLYVVGVEGGAERRIADFGFRPQWSPDGTRVLFTDVDVEGPQPALYVASLDGAPPRQVRADLTSGARRVAGSWHPDGRLSLLTRGRSGWKFLTAELDAGAPMESTLAREVAQRLADVTPRRFRWASSGRFVFFEGHTPDVSNLWRASVDARTLRWTSVDQLTVAAGRYRNLALSPDGRTLVFSSVTEQTRLWSFAYNAVQRRLSESGVAVTPGGADEFDASAPPDGTRLVFRIVRTGRQELWEHSFDSGQNRLLLASHDSLSSPRWSRDGTRLAYRRGLADSPAGEGAVIAILSATAGSEERLRMKSAKDHVVPDDWSPDGARLLAACSVGGRQRMGICVVPVSGADAGHATVLAEDPERELLSPRFSPDQRWISFMAVDRTRSRSARLYVMPADGGDWVPLSDGSSYDDKPRWSPDGRAVLFISDRGGPLNLWARPFDPATGQPTADAIRLTNFTDLDRRLAPSLGRMEIAVSNDRVFLPITETSGRIWTLEHVDR